MAASTVPPSVQLLHILNYSLATDESAACNISATLDVLDGTHLIVKAQDEVASASAQDSERVQSVLHRWTLRLTALTGSKIAAVQAAGFDLALETSRQSEGLFLQHAKAWFASALSVLTRRTPASLDAFSAATEFLLFSFNKAKHLPEFAREIANAGAVRKTGEGLLNFAGSEACDAAIRVAALDYLSDLIIISSSPLRPVSQNIQNVAVSLLCTWSNDDSLQVASSSAARLLSNVYIIAGKVQAAQSWRKTVESLVGSSHLLLHSLVSTMVEEQGYPVPPPLDLPPIASTSAAKGLAQQGAMLKMTVQRLKALLNTIILMLSTSTERAVPVPVGCLVRLCYRLLSLNASAPPHERHDANLRLAQLALLPQLHEQACRLLGQLLITAGGYLTNDACRLLFQAAYLIGTYPARSPTRTSLQALASLLVEYTYLHPDDATEPLTIIIQSILRDAAMLVDPEEGRGKTALQTVQKGQNGTTDRKAKRARLFEADQVMSTRKRTTSHEAALISHSLSSLHRCLLHGSWLFSPTLLTQTLRLLLAYSLSPQFLNAPPTFAPNNLLSEGLSYAPQIRLHVLQCLVAAARALPKESQGFLEHVLSVLRDAAQSSVIGAEGRSTCADGIASIDNMLRPVVPPLIKSLHLRQAMRNINADLTGSSEDTTSDVDENDPNVDTSHVLQPTGAQTTPSASVSLSTLPDTIEPGNTYEPRTRRNMPEPSLFLPKPPPPPEQEETMGSLRAPSTTMTPSARRSISAKQETVSHAAPASLAVASVTSSIVQVGELKHQEGGSLAEESGAIQEVDDEDQSVAAGLQATLLNATWDDDNGDDTSEDDDAPMPKIYLSGDADSDEDMASRHKE